MTDRRDLWEAIRAARRRGEPTREIAAHFGLTVQGVNNILSHRRDPKRPGPRSHRQNPRSLTYAAEWFDEHPQGTIRECQAALAHQNLAHLSAMTLSRVQNGFYLTYEQSLKRDYGNACIGLASASIDELAEAVVPDGDERFYQRLRERMNPYMLAIFAAIHNKPHHSQYAARFTRIFQREITRDLMVHEDICAAVEMAFWRLACIYRSDRGMKFFTHLNRWLPFKVIEEVKGIYAFIDHVDLDEKL